MAAFSYPSERFVEIPGIVEIRYRFDDPDEHRAPDDLFDKQQDGLDGQQLSTEQAYFTCNVCDCDLKRIITLRAHCKGTQHIRKALQKKKKWRRSQEIP